MRNYSNDIIGNLNTEDEVYIEVYKDGTVDLNVDNLSTGENVTIHMTQDEFIKLFEEYICILKGERI